MPSLPTGAEAGKYAAARCASDLVADGMRLGLGTGSTAAWMVRCVAARVRDEGLRLTCVPTSTRTAALARSLGLNVVDLDRAGWLDLTIDGADEFDPALNLIKGGGGALLQEKVVAAASDRMVVITDPSKEVAALGGFPLPVEVLQFGRATSLRQIEAVLAAHGHGGTRIGLRMARADPFVTDEGNHILDLHLQRIDAPAALATDLLAIPGVVETGLFLGMCAQVVIGHEDGTAETLLADGTRTQARVDPAGAARLPDPTGTARLEGTA
jgi:ribose 5-phosphate isomerase A